MAVIKIGDKVSFHLAENREQLVADLKRGTRMYGWQRGEDIESTIENFALANPHATMGQFIDWTKKTGMIRLAAIKAGKELPTYSLNLIEMVENAKNIASNSQPPVTRQPQRVESTPARLKAPGQTQARKVAEPGQEPDDLDKDGDPRDADLGEQKDGPGTPDYAALRNLPATDPSAGKPDPVDPPYVEDKAKPANPLAARLAEMAQGKS